MTGALRDEVASEQRPSYRTLNEPTRLLGLSLSAWAAVIAAGGLAYGFLNVSPLPWRFNFSAVAIGLGAPVLLLILREPGTIGPGRLLLAVIAWRTSSQRIASPQAELPLRRGAVRLDAPIELIDEPAAESDLAWIEAQQG